MEKETVKVECSGGFIYETTFEYSPSFGFTNALYNGDIINQCCLNKLHEPTNDDDFAWDVYSQNFEEWKDAMKTNLIPKCVEYFDRKSA